jgi:NhaP-type Na+/H+ or K+/H+ antiporter
VVTVAALSDAVSNDTGLVAAITMGIVIANLHGVNVPEDRPFLKTVVQLTIGVLFISISATVTWASLRGAVWRTIGLIACLVVLVRPAVALVATFRTDLTRNERIFVGSMDPRGIVAASTAATFSAPLIALGIAGANKLLPATFLVIVGTVTIYGLGATPLVRALGLRCDEPENTP